MKLKKEFIWGLLTGIMMAGSIPMASMANQMVSAMRTSQTIYLDGDSVDWTVYNVLDENYIRLADLCPELGVGLVWDPVANAVRMNSDGTIPEITPAPESLDYYSPSPSESTIPFPMPDMSYFSDSVAAAIDFSVNSWANMAVYGILAGYMDLDTQDFVSQITDAAIIDVNGETYFRKDTQDLGTVRLDPVSSYSQTYDSTAQAMTFVYVLETREGDSLAIRIDVAGSNASGAFNFGSVKVLATYDGSPGYYYRALSDDNGNYLLFRETRENLYTNTWDFPAYHYGSHSMTNQFLIGVWDENDQLVGWEPVT